MMIWEGWNLDYWAQSATLKARGRQPREEDSFGWYSGFEEIGLYIVPDIPLHIRYASFCERLDRKILAL